MPGSAGTFFETLGVPAAIGRALQPQDDVPGGPNVLVLSHAAWLDRFGGDPAIVGRTLRLDGEAQTVVGVMPAGFDYPRGAEYWAPLAPGLAAASAAVEDRRARQCRRAVFVARLKRRRQRRHRRRRPLGDRPPARRGPPRTAGRQPGRADAAGRARHRSGAAGPVGAARRGDGAAAHRLRQRVGPDADPGLPRSPRAGDPAGHGRLGSRAGAAVAGRSRCPRAAWWQCRHRAGRRAHQADARAGARRHPAADRGRAEPPGRGRRAGRHRDWPPWSAAPARCAWRAARICSTPCSRRRGRRRRCGRCGCARCSSSCRWRWPSSCSSRPGW